VGKESSCIYKKGEKMRSKETAIAGLFVAVTLILLFAGSLIPVNRIFFAFISALVVETLTFLTKKRIVFLVYISASLLSLFLLPLKSYAILYIIFFGGYSVFRMIISNLKRIIKLIFKIIYLNLSFIVLFWIVKEIFSDIFSKFFNFSDWQIIIILFVLEISLFLYDILLSKGGKTGNSVIKRYFGQNGPLT